MCSLISQVLHGRKQCAHFVALLRQDCHRRVTTVKATQFLRATDIHTSFNSGEHKP